MERRPRENSTRHIIFPKFFRRSGLPAFMGYDGMVTNLSNLQNRLFPTNFYWSRLLNLFLSENHEVGMILPCVSLLY